MGSSRLSGSVVASGASGLARRGRGYRCPWLGCSKEVLPAPAWPDVPAVSHTASPPPTAPAALCATLCPSAQSWTVHPSVPTHCHVPQPYLCTSPAPMRPLCASASPLMPGCSSAPASPNHTCARPRAHAPPLHTSAPPYLCPPVLGTAHATGPSSSSRTTSGFLILRPRARAAGWALLAGRGGHAWPRCVTGGCRGGIRHLAGGDGGGLCTRRFHTDTVTAPSTRPGALPSRPASSPPCQPRLQHPATRLGTCSGSPRPRPSPLPIPGGSSSPGTGRNGELRESPPAPARRGPADTVGRQRERGERAAGAGARRGTARTACTARTAHTARSSLCTRTHAAHTVHNPPRHNNPRGRRCPLTRPRSHVSMPPAPPRAT